MKKKLLNLWWKWTAYRSRVKKTKDRHALHKWNNIRVALSFVIGNNIEGDYLEFGVLKGESFIYAYKQFHDMFAKYKEYQKAKSSPFLDQEVRFFAFDSFEGLPENDDQDIPLHWTGDKPMSYPRFLFDQNLQTAKLDPKKVVITEGYYDQTLTESLYEKINLKRAAIIHIDCDLYDSTKTVLDTIQPLIGEGTVIVFDDYFYYKGSPYKGERGAFNEWLIQNPEWVPSELSKYYPGAAFILNKKVEGKEYVV